MNTRYMPKSNRKKLIFPTGKTRYVCVNRKAIVANLEEQKNYPTIVMMDYDRKLYEFHEAKFEGLLQFDEGRNDLPAKVFVETENEVIGFLDEKSDQSFLSVKQPSLGARIRKKIRNIVNHTPIIACFFGDE